MLPNAVLGNCFGDWMKRSARRTHHHKQETVTLTFYGHALLVKKIEEDENTFVNSCSVWCQV